jgi:MFS transporter, DHA1 family, multidrug resistance protein
MLPPMLPERRLLLWMCALIGVNQLGFGAMIPTMALYADSFAVGVSAVGISVAVYGLARCVLAVPSGRIADHWGRREALALGGVVTGIGNLWCAWASSFPEFVIARFVAGAGAGLVTAAGQVVLADISPIEQRGRMLSIYQGTFIFAVSIGPFPGGLIAERYGLAAPFVACGLAGLAATVIAWFAVGETKNFRRAGSAAPQAISTLPLGQQMRQLFAHRGFVLVSLISLCNAFVRTGGLFAIIPLLATTKLNLSVSAIGFAFMLGGLMGLLAAYPGGWITDRYGRKAVIVPTALAGAASILLYAIASSYTGFLVASIVWSVAMTIGSAAPATYAADTAPPGMNAAAMGAYRMTSDIGYVIGPLVLGIVADLAGPVPALITGAAIMAASGIIFALFAPETYRSKSKL